MAHCILQGIGENMRISVDVDKLAARIRPMARYTRGRKPRHFVEGANRTKLASLHVLVPIDLVNSVEQLCANFNEPKSHVVERALRCCIRLWLNRLIDLSAWSIQTNYRDQVSGNLTLCNKT
jgi:hypothetical protein